MADVIPPFVRPAPTHTQRRREGKTSSYVFPSHPTPTTLTEGESHPQPNPQGEEEVLPNPPTTATHREGGRRLRLWGGLGGPASTQAHDHICSCACAFPALPPNSFPPPVCFKSANAHRDGAPGRHPGSCHHFWCFKASSFVPSCFHRISEAPTVTGIGAVLITGVSQETF